MNFRSRQLLTIGATVCLALIGLNDAHAQKRRRAPEKRSVLVNSASHVSAEMAKGTLRPSETKPGDEVALRLTDDVKANGDVVLKKGTRITGIVRNVKSTEMKGQQQSMMEIEWFAPPLQGKVARQLSIALQAVTEVGRLTEEPSSKNVEQFRFKPTDGARNTPEPRGPARANAALVNMPSVIAVDQKTASSLESSFGTSATQLFKVGHSEWITAGGSKQSVELFSHLSNDTLITSASKDFEITSGAQMQLLVGVSKQ
jgi:hypothetical protein